MQLVIVNLSALAAQLDRSFYMVTLATVGELAISLYICQGQLEWHKHIDEDELFLVHNGVMVLETTRGTVTLHAEELVVVPKGVTHRSTSALRSVVVLIHPVGLPQRKNGHRRLYPLESDPPLEKVRLAQVSATLSEAVASASIARIEDFEVILSALAANDYSHTAPSYGALLWVLRGEIEVHSGFLIRHLKEGELTVIPADISYHLRVLQPSLTLTLERV